MTESKKLFIVSIQNEIIVLADSLHEAAQLAKFESDIEMDKADYFASPMNHFPGDWDAKCIPFGDRADEAPDRTVGEWIEAGAAPEYVANRKSLVKKIEESEKP